MLMLQMATAKEVPDVAAKSPLWMLDLLMSVSCMIINAVQDTATCP